MNNPLRKRRSNQQVAHTVQTTDVELPAGGPLLGVRFEGTPPVITEVEADSALCDMLRVGQVVEKVIIPGVVESECLDGADLEYLLCSAKEEAESESAASANVEGRILAIKTDESEYKSEGRRSKVYLPRECSAFGSLELTFENHDPIVTSVQDHSPLVHRVRPAGGQIVRQYCRMHKKSGVVRSNDVLSTKSLREPDFIGPHEKKWVRYLVVENVNVEALHYRERKKLMLKVGAVIFPLLIAVVVIAKTSKPCGIGSGRYCPPYSRSGGRDEIAIATVIAVLFVATACWYVRKGG